jgi:hypothetical protein
MLTIANPALVPLTILSAWCDERGNKKAASTTRLFQIQQLAGNKASVLIESGPKPWVLVLTRFLDANRGFYRHSTLVIS